MLPPGLMTRSAITAILILQFVPLLLLPPEAFGPTTQEWWLPAMLAALALLAAAELVGRGSLKLWPWHLMIFAHGFNIISRLMTVWAHATKIVGGQTVANLPYLLTAGLAVAGSAFLLWYFEQPAVRMGLLRESRR